MKKKKTNQQRVSNRTYPPKLCKKEDCYLEFIPTDGRQVYCDAQHRIDSNNDKRKILDKHESSFNKSARKNLQVLIKIYNSIEYIDSGKVDESLLSYEGYNLSIYHRAQIDLDTGREVKFCFDYGLMLIDSKNRYYKIIKND